MSDNFISTCFFCTALLFLASPSNAYSEEFICLDKNNAFVDKRNKNCFHKIRLIQRHKKLFKQQLSADSEYIEFKKNIDLTNLKHNFQQLKLTKKETKRAIQNLTKNLNIESVNNYYKSLKKDQKSRLKKIRYVALNNSAIFFYTSSDKKRKYKHAIDHIYSENIIRESANNFSVVGLLDSGVSNKHESFKNIDVLQYNPANDSHDLIDSGLGHGTGIIYLIDKLYQESKAYRQSYYNKNKIKYLSCNGLPQGRFNKLTVIQCLDWFFMQSKVDVLANAWLVDQPGCHIEWQYPLELLWLSDIVSVFAAGNYGMEPGQSYTPANLFYSTDTTPLISVGAIDDKNQKLATTSSGESSCKTSSPHVSLVAQGKDWLVASPIAINSYQKVSGTSYAIAPVIVSFLKAKIDFPALSVSTIVRTFLDTTLDLGETGKDYEFGYGKLNIERAYETLSQLNQL
nr:S8/S53 family peptidase [Aliikangiella sp. G2MR2-5]